MLIFLKCVACFCQTCMCVYKCVRTHTGSKLYLQHFEQFSSWHILLCLIICVLQDCNSSEAKVLVSFVPENISQFTEVLANLLVQSNLLPYSRTGLLQNFSSLSFRHSNSLITQDIYLLFLGLFCSLSAVLIYIMHFQYDALIIPKYMSLLTLLNIFLLF